MVLPFLPSFHYTSPPNSWSFLSCPASIMPLLLPHGPSFPALFPSRLSSHLMVLPFLPSFHHTSPPTSWSFPSCPPSITSLLPPHGPSFPALLPSCLSSHLVVLAFLPSLHHPNAFPPLPRPRLAPTLPFTRRKALLHQRWAVITRRRLGPAQVGHTVTVPWGDVHPRSAPMAHCFTPVCAGWRGGWAAWGPPAANQRCHLLDKQGRRDHKERRKPAAPRQRDGCQTPPLLLARALPARRKPEPSYFWPSNRGKVGEMWLWGGKTAPRRHWGYWERSTQRSPGPARGRGRHGGLSSPNLTFPGVFRVAADAGDIVQWADGLRAPWWFKAETDSAPPQDPVPMAAKSTPARQLGSAMSPLPGTSPCPPKPASATGGAPAATTLPLAPAPDTAQSSPNPASTELGRGILNLKPPLLKKTPCFFLHGGETRLREGIWRLGRQRQREAPGAHRPGQRVPSAVPSPRDAQINRLVPQSL